MRLKARLLLFRGFAWEIAAKSSTSVCFVLHKKGFQFFYDYHKIYLFNYYFFQVIPLKNLSFPFPLGGKTNYWGRPPKKTLVTPLFRSVRQRSHNSRSLSFLSDSLRSALKKKKRPRIMASLSPLWNNILLVH